MGKFVTPILTETTLYNFWRYVDIQGPDECWEWQGHSRNGYGCFHLTSGAIYTHRFSYWLHKGPIPDDILVCHECDNKPCVNPDHLFLGTIQINNLDSKLKGRRVIGEMAGAFRLTADDVLYIRAIYPEIRSYRKIAKIYDISYSTVQQVVRRETWTHI